MRTVRKYEVDYPNRIGAICKTECPVFPGNYIGSLGCGTCDWFLGHVESDSVLCGAPHLLKRIWIKLWRLI